VEVAHDLRRGRYPGLDLLARKVAGAFFEGARYLGCPLGAVALLALKGINASIVKPNVASAVLVGWLVV
jgi:hypothetical protein